MPVLCSTGAEGQRVRYIPLHAQGDPAHPDCEDGLVSSWRGDLVFVRYYRRDGSLQSHAQCTDRQCLTWWMALLPEHRQLVNPKEERTQRP